MCRCDTDECCNLRAEYIDSRIGRLVSEQADPPEGVREMTEAECDHGSYAILMFGERECLICGEIELPPLKSHAIEGEGSTDD
jgi:hypothetical protein